MPSSPFLLVGLEVSSIVGWNLNVKAEDTYMSAIDSPYAAGS